MHAEAQGAALSRRGIKAISLREFMTPHLDQLFERRPELLACRDDISRTLQILETTFAQGGKLLLCGNGGSAADCEHIAGELMKGFLLPRPIPDEHRNALGEMGAVLQGALPAIALTAHSALASAVINDTRGDMVFAQQVYGLGKPGDALLAISTSGNSPNVLHALRVARLRGVHTLGLTGQTGGRMVDAVDVCIRVPADTVVPIQELHLPVYHTLCAAIESRFFE